MTIIKDYTNPQGDVFTDAVIEITQCNRDNATRYGFNYDFNLGDYAETNSSDDNINYMASMWSTEANRDDLKPAYSVVGINGSSYFGFALSGEYLTAYENAVGTEIEKLKAACELHLNSQI